MKKLLLGFIAIGLLTFVGCDKDDETEAKTEIKTETTDEIVASSDDENKETTSASSAVEYGEGATDINGNAYKSVIIGEQEWMAENLRTTKYSDGTAIPNVIDDDEWIDLETGAWSNYNNESQNDSTYGKLYNWYAVETGKLCPTGWHVPTENEWVEIIDYLAVNGHVGKEAVALKSLSGWDYGNGTDDYSWSGLPGGYRYPSGFFYEVGESGGWWSSSENRNSSAWCNDFFNSEQSIIKSENSKKFGNSVRCLRD